MKKIILAFSAFLFVGVIYAQDNSLLNKLVEKNVITQAEAREIAESQNVKTDNVVKFFNNPYVQLSGYGIFKYEYNNNDTYADGKFHDFRPRVVYLTMSGNIKDKLRYSVLFDFAKPKLHELWAEWTPCDYFRLKLGQFKVPLSFENQFAPGNLEYSSFSRPTQYLMGHNLDIIGNNPYSDAKNNIGRDIGIQASGTVFKVKGESFLEYALGVFQGSGINAVDADNTKDLAASLTLLPVKGLRLGGGAYFGESTYQFGGVSDKIVRNRYVASAEYTVGRFKTRAEYMRGQNSIITLDGAYGMVMFDLIPKKFNVLGKLSYFDENKDSHSEVFDYTFGLNYNIFALTRIQLNYTYADYKENWGSGYRENHNITVQFQIGF